jgi:hypothetical protein
MLNLGKIQGNLFGGIVGATASLPNSISITKDYLLPLIKDNLQGFEFGTTLFLLLNVTIFIASVIWIKEIVEDIERTSRFMSQQRFNDFMIKTIVIGVAAFFVGLIINKFIFIS